MKNFIRILVTYFYSIIFNASFAFAGLSSCFIAINPNHPVNRELGARQAWIESEPSLEFIPVFDDSKPPGVYSRMAHSLGLLAKWSRSNRNETVLLLPSYKGQSIPAFDGIVFDSNNIAKANLVLRVLSSNRKPVAAALLTMDKAVQWTYHRDRWGQYLNLDLLPYQEFLKAAQAWARFSGDESGQLLSQLHAKRIDQTEYAKFNWYREVQEVFGLTFNSVDARPLRVIIDLRHSIELPTKRNIVEIQKKIQSYNTNLASKTIEKLIFLQREEFIEITDSEIQHHSMTKGY